MIEKTQPDEIRGRRQPTREFPIFPRGRWISGRMVVVHDERGGVRQERSLQEFPRLDDGAIERPPIDLRIIAEKPVARVQVERPRPLLGAVSTGPPQVFLDERGLVHQVPRGERLGRQAPADLDRGFDRGRARFPDAPLPRELPAGETRETRETAVRGEESPRAVGSAFAASAGSEQEGEELFRGERRRTRTCETLAGPVVGGEVANPEARVQGLTLVDNRAVGSPLRSLILVVGLVLVAAAVAWPIVSRYFGRLPGDIVVRRPGFTFVFPIVTCLLLSLVLTLLLWIFRR